MMISYIRDRSVMQGDHRTPEGQEGYPRSSTDTHLYSPRWAIQPGEVVVLLGVVLLMNVSSSGVARRYAGKLLIRAIGATHQVDRGEVR